MTEPVLKQIDISKLIHVENPCDPRRDLHVFIDYVKERTVKRSTRGNGLSKTDAAKLAKSMSDPKAFKDVNETGESLWVDFIDSLALKLGFVKYDTEGSYRGYSSMEPSFIDNYIEFKSKPYEDFLARSILEQEKLLQKCLIDTWGNAKNEFMSKAILGRLDVFDFRGCAIGVLPTLNFGSIRRFLLGILAQCASGVWYSTSSLTQYLKQEHPFFLIPKNFTVKSRYDKKERYGNFCERPAGKWCDGKEIDEKMPNAFELVEGRYLERFLEGIPLLLGYVEVAYDQKEKQAIEPSRGLLKAFRVRDSYLRIAHGEIPEAKVVVQPNFEIHITSEIYPAKAVSVLRPLTDTVKEDRSIVLRLQKQKVAYELTQRQGLDVCTLLTSLSGRTLPENVISEIKEWGSHAEAFVLYEGFGLLEGCVSQQFVNSHRITSISPVLDIIDFPDKVYAALEEKEMVPLLLVHPDQSLKAPPPEAITVFEKKSKEEKRPKEHMTLRRQLTVTLIFPSEKLLGRCCSKLQEEDCFFEQNAGKCALTISDKDEPLTRRILRNLNDEYSINIEDVV